MPVYAARSGAMLSITTQEIHKFNWLPAQGEDSIVPSPAASSLSQIALHVAASVLWLYSVH